MIPARWQRFLAFLAGHFRANFSLRTAAALSYTTLLSLVPLLTVMFSVVSAFPVFDEVVTRLQDYIFRNFVPASGQVVQSYIQQFLRQSARLTGPGIVFLVLVAVMLMDTIDGVLNGIWKVRRRRRWLAQFLVYWSVLTLGPLLLAVSIVVTSYLVSLSLLTGVDPGGTLQGLLLSVMPFLSIMVALTLLYVLVPNRSVPLRHGLTGAAVAAILFELAKRGFTLYVANVPTYATIYGALAVIPLFLVWIYVSWVVVLLGAELTYCLTVFRDGRPRTAGLRDEQANFVHTFRVLGHLWEAQRTGMALNLEALASKEREVGHDRLEDILMVLEEQRFTSATADGAWVLIRDLDEITLWDLYNAMPHALPPGEGAWQKRDGWNRRLGNLLQTAGDCLARTFDVPLRQLYEEAPR